MDVARVTLAHGTTAEAVDRIRLLRYVVPSVGVLVDLPGPKVRAGAFPPGGVTLVADATILLRRRGARRAEHGDPHRRLQRPAVDDLQVGDRVALGDGGVALVVTGRCPRERRAKVRSGGLLQGRPGVTAPAGRLALGDADA